MTLSNQAQNLIEEFRQRIETLPAEERVEAIKKMTESLEALNQEMRRVYDALHTVRSKQDIENIEEKLRKAESHISDYI